MGRNLTPLPHYHREICDFFPSFFPVIRDSYPSNSGMSKEETETHLDELEIALQKDVEALSSCK